jgi:hypothetical protein
MIWSSDDTLSHPVANDDRFGRRLGKLPSGVDGEVHGSFMFSLDAFLTALRVSNPGKQAMWVQIVFAMRRLLWFLDGTAGWYDGLGGRWF